MALPDPYIRKNPNDLIRSGDWNDIQSHARQELRAHTHRGGDDGTQIPREGIVPGAIDGSLIDPAATIGLAKLSVSSSLKVLDRELLTDINNLLARATALEARATTLEKGKVNRAGDTITGPLTVQGQVVVTGSVQAQRYRGTNALVLNDFQVANPTSNVYLESPGNDRDSWIFRDSADLNSNWGIYHRQIDSEVKGLPANSIGFIGGGNSALKGYVSLQTGNAYFAGSLGVTGGVTVGTGGNAVLRTRHINGKAYDADNEDALYLNWGNSKPVVIGNPNALSGLDIYGSVRATGAGHFGGNAGVLDLEGIDHAYIQWYPMGAASGRKGWIGYGGADTKILSIQSEAGPLHLGGAGVSVRSSLEVTDGSRFSGGRHFFKDEEGCGWLRVGAAWGVPGLYAEDSQDLVLGCASGHNVYLGQTDGVIVRNGKLATCGYDPDQGLSHGWGGGITTWDIIVNANGFAHGSFQSGAFDLAEKFERHEEGLEPGDVLAVDPYSPERLVKSRSAQQGDLIGVISERPGFILGVDWEDPGAGIPLALAGRVPVKVNLEGGPIRIGDYLTSSSEPGVAMRTIRPGRVIGLAMGAFDGSPGTQGKVVVLVNPHWFGGR